MTKSILVYGFGNIGRQDDGLGVLLAEQIDELKIPGVKVEVNFQLNAEDAMTVSEHELVVFLDASLATDQAFELEAVTAENAIAFSTHAMSPASILAFSEEMYQKCPESYILHLRGYEWDFGLPLSTAAQSNLEAACDYLVPWLRERLRLSKAS
jgi:hydrogenase maturation protease